MGTEQIAAPVQPNAAKLPILLNASFLSKAIILCYSSNGNGTPHPVSKSVKKLQCKPFLATQSIHRTNPNSCI
ncbi:hypothetical protein HYALB_00005167 [Hymenoscyphus albidus]|uniref:Uncharacterized protein n=1 Tax=Hymenoscyphus albidus TaxID=595503 RepID=A0A9N9Q9F1_9HELO|nr:hypothetical protein HYALB_00005167 [Hymenoscyphus albidus]